jgi:hypothetical protein
MLSICAALSMSVGALIASDARADDVCNTLTSPIGNIVVPEEATCFLSNVTVNGNIEQQSGSILQLSGGVTVNGNISSNGGAITGVIVSNGPNVIAGSVDIVSNTTNVVICGSQIIGNVTISNTIPGPGFITIGAALFCGLPPTGNMIGGSVSITNNDASILSVEGNIPSARI